VGVCGLLHEGSLTAVSNTLKPKFDALQLNTSALLLVVVIIVLILLLLLASIQERAANVLESSKRPWQN
jgi:hypothetical protein